MRSLYNLGFRLTRQTSSAVASDDGMAEEYQYKGYRLIIHSLDEKFSAVIWAPGSKMPDHRIDYAGYLPSRDVVVDDAKQIVEGLLQT